MDRLVWTYEGEVEPHESVRRDLAWMRRAASRGPEAEPIMRLWRPPKECLLFGRYLRVPDSLMSGSDILIARRLGGGRAVFSGPGFLNMSLVVPEPRELSDRRGGSVPIPTEKILNRYVRGLLSGLTSLGVKAFYPGREWVTASGRRLAFVSFDRDEAGVCLFEAVIALEGHAARGDLLLPSHGIVYQSGKGCPANVTTVAEVATAGAIGPERLGEVIASGYAARFSLEVSRLESAPDDMPRVDPPDEAWLTGRSPRSEQTHRATLEIPVGMLEVLLGVTSDEKLTHVTLAGDFLANSPAVAQYEEALEGCAAGWENVGRITDQVFLAPPNTILGLGSLSVLPDTILRAVSPSGP